MSAVWRICPQPGGPYSVGLNAGIGKRSVGRVYHHVLIALIEKIPEFGAANTDDGNFVFHGSTRPDGTSNNNDGSGRLRASGGAPARPAFRFARRAPQNRSSGTGSVRRRSIRRPP